MTSAPPSIARIVWDGLGKKPALAATLVGTAALLWVAGGVFALLRRRAADVKRALER